jgi:hypothetical protein
MSNGTLPPPAQMPMTLAIAPFPEGFKGDTDETWQQGVALMTAYVEGYLLTGLILPAGSTPPTTNVGPVLIGNQWYFWDPATQQYLPQSASVKVAKNYAKNAVYQIQQTGPAFANITAGVTRTYDLALVRSQLANVLGITQVAGPPASGDNDAIASAIKYTVGPSTVAAPAATDIYCHEHLIEGVDLAPALGQTLSVSFFVNSTAPGTYSGYLASSARDSSYAFNFTIPTANTWQRVKIQSIPPIPTTVGTWNMGEGQTGVYIGIVFAVGSQYQTTTPGSWQSGLFMGTAQNGNFCAVGNNQMTITGIKLEASPTTTYLSVPSFEADYQDAIRYYWTNFNYQSLTTGMPMTFVASGTNNAYGTLIFPRRMSKIPTVVPYGTSSHAAGNVTNLSTSTDIAVATLSAVQKGTGGSVTAAGTKGDVYGAYVTADARLS